MSLPVGSSIASVYVAERRWSNHGVVKGGVEYLQSLIVLALYLYLSKLLVPCLVRSLGSRLKVPARKFSFHIGVCSLHAHRRECHLHHDLILWLCFKVCMCECGHVLELVLPYLDVASDDLEILERL